MARSQLIQLLRDHGFRAYARYGYLYALDLYTDEAGCVHEHFVALRPRLKVVMAFLGY
jgi:hypothetical protein